MYDTNTTLFVIVKEHFKCVKVAGLIEFVGKFEWQTFMFYRQHYAVVAGVQFGGESAKSDLFFHD